jgi:5-methyltetrahydropteroyltriglutamate--homocysteine methyltransferase
VNTACSSALVAVDSALRDAKAGRIDFAVVGGVNLFGDDQQLFQDLRRAGMLSPTGRCHTFSEAADGYVRSEGGVLFLLHAGSNLPSRARILGSAVTQNSTRKPLSAVDPIAQERVIRLACADAAIKPSQLTVVEMHGTGTPLGDPVEISALKRVVGEKSEAKCTLTAVKMHMGHLESAAGAAGLLKAVLMLEKKRVPGFAVDGKGVNPQVSTALVGSNLANPGESRALEKDSLIGVSSFGFAGSNSHIIVAAAQDSSTLPLEVASREVAVSTLKPSPSFVLGQTTVTCSVAASVECSEEESESDQPKPALAVVSNAVLSIVGGDLSIDIDAELADVGVDSLGLAELLGRLEDSYGVGCITIDKIMDMRNVRSIADYLSKQASKMSSVEVQIGQPATTTAKSMAVEATEPKSKPNEAAPSDVEATVSRAVGAIVGSDELIDPDANLADLGVDSLGLAELLGRLEDEFGHGCITIDKMMDARSVKAIAGHLGGKSVRSVAISPNVVAVSPPSSSIAQKSKQSESQTASMSTPTKKDSVISKGAAPDAMKREGGISIVSGAVRAIVGDDVDVDHHADLADIGVDSLGLAELLGRLEDTFGQGCITIDQIMDKRTIADIAGLLESRGFASAAESAKITAARPIDARIATPAMSFKAPPAMSDCSESETLKSWNIVQIPANSETTQDSSKVMTTKSWICTTHVGSLPRPADGNFDLERIIQQQVEAGVDMINDGEWSRDNYIADVIDRIEGLRGGDDAGVRQGCSTVHVMPCADDMKDVPVYAQRFTGGNGLITLNPKREALSDLACVSHPRYVPAKIPSLSPFVQALKKAGKSLEDGFYSVPSPGTLALFCTDLFFNDHEAYVTALGEALAGEFAEIARSGVQLQVDCPDLAMGRHTRWANLDDAEFIRIAHANVDALNSALRAVPFEQIRVHVCWGNYAGPHHKDMPADLVWPVLGKVKAKYLLVEGANACHRNDVSAFERAVKCGHFKPNQVIVPGMIDTTTARIEHPNLIAESLLRYVRAAGHPSRVLAGTDCGFASTAKSTAITSDIAWMKLKSLA